MSAEHTFPDPDIQVEVVTAYLAAQSSPAREHYVFSYTITVSHRGGSNCQLLRRYWRIVDGMGDVEEVRGDGVVGQQPRLQSGQAFTYTSGAILKTPVGSMQGAYTFIDAAGREFEVPIAAFTLSVPHQVH